MLEALRDLKHHPTFIERLTDAFGTRVVEPLAERVQRRSAR
jgi:hypothetical protein